jgi:hypothetical protein
MVLAHPFKMPMATVSQKLPNIARNMTQIDLHLDVQSAILTLGSVLLISVRPVLVLRPANQ